MCVYTSRLVWVCVCVCDQSHRGLVFATRYTTTLQQELTYRGSLQDVFVHMELGAVLA
jgi:hypothetical protein